MFGTKSIFGVSVEHLWCITTAVPLYPLSLPLAHDMWMYQHLCGHTLTDTILMIYCCILLGLPVGCVVCVP